MNVLTNVKAKDKFTPDWQTVDGSVQLYCADYCHSPLVRVQADARTSEGSLPDNQNAGQSAERGLFS